MAGVAKERIKDWLRRRFSPLAKYVEVYECADVTQLLGPADRRYGVGPREAMLFASRDVASPAPRKEVVILTSVLANYSAERIISTLESSVAPNLAARPHLRLLVADGLRIFSWGESSTGEPVAETEPCEAPQPSEDQT
jgi:hypothetical protein